MVKIKKEVEIDVELSELAEIFSKLDSEQQAEFFSQVYKNFKSFELHTQAAYIDAYLDEPGREFIKILWQNINAKRCPCCDELIDEGHLKTLGECPDCYRKNTRP
jgi:hypothetical protein